jgi:hypothetical protein
MTQTETLAVMDVLHVEDQIDIDWFNMYRRCFVSPWSLGVLQVEYVYFMNPLVIIDDCND